MKKANRMARVTWSRKDKRWVLYLWDEESESWEFSKSWKIKDENMNGDGWVSDTILCDIAEMQNWGYDVRIWL